jgi:leader peptidase (prepilin peptidase)/N-methyltransferase
LISDPENASNRAFFGGPSPPFPACRRRRRVLGPLGRDILFGRGDARPLTLAAWVSLLALAALTAQTSETGWLLAPSLSLFVGLCVLALFDARYFVIPDGPLLWLVFWGLNM